MKTKGRYLWLAQTLVLNVCDAPKARVGEIVQLAPTCRLETSQIPHVGVCAIPRESTEQSENVYENKGSLR